EQAACLTPSRAPIDYSGSRGTALPREAANRPGTASTIGSLPSGPITFVMEGAGAAPSMPPHSPLLRSAAPAWSPGWRGPWYKEAGAGPREPGPGRGGAGMKLEANGVHINYRIDGPEGAPWVTMSNSLATTHRMWDAQMAAFTKRYRVLRYDKRGH